MSDYNPFHSKTDAITTFVATSGIPTPIWISYVDETAKVAAAIYSIIAAVYLVKKLFSPK